MLKWKEIGLCIHGDCIEYTKWVSSLKLIIFIVKVYSYFTNIFIPNNEQKWKVKIHV